MFDRLETRVPPLVWMLLSIGVVLLVSMNGDRLVPAERSAVVGSVFISLGIFVAASAFFDFRRVETTANPLDIEKVDSLVTGGVFRFTRNPMYLGMLFAVIGVGIRTGSLLAVFAGGAFFVIVLTRLQIIPEERVLREHFGTAYDDFASSVRRWI